MIVLTAFAAWCRVAPVLLRAIRGWRCPARRPRQEALTDHRERNVDQVEPLGVWSVIPVAASTSIAAEVLHRHSPLGRGGRRSLCAYF